MTKQEPLENHATWMIGLEIQQNKELREQIKTDIETIWTQIRRDNQTTQASDDEYTKIAEERLAHMLYTYFVKRLNSSLTDKFSYSFAATAIDSADLEGIASDLINPNK